jgi:hypothetical protein
MERIIDKDVCKSTFVANEANASVPIPRRWYGKEVTVTICVTNPEPDLKYGKDPAMMTPEERGAILDKIFAPYRFPLKDFKFDRNEANDYD